MSESEWRREQVADAENFVRAMRIILGDPPLSDEDVSRVARKVLRAIPGIKLSAPPTPAAASGTPTGER